MADAARRLSPDEIEERRAFLQRLKTDFPKRDASVVSLDTKRRPLGLAPAPVEDEPQECGDEPLDRGALMHGPVIDLADHDRAFLDSAAPVELVYISLNAAGDMLDNVTRKLKERCAGLERRSRS